MVANLGEVGDSVMMPTTLRLAVRATRQGRILCSSSSTIAGGVPWAVRTVAICWAILVGRVTAGASGINTGSNVVSLTSKATWGFQNRAVAYHSPNSVVD